MQHHENRPPQDTSRLRQTDQPPGTRRAASVLAASAGAAHQHKSQPALPDLRGLLLVVLVAGWLAGMLFENWAAVPFWLLLLAGGLAGVLAVFTRSFRLPTRISRWLTLGLLVLACAALGAGRLASASPAGDPAAVSSFIGRGAVEIRGSISAEPDLRARSILLEVDASSLSLDNGHTWQQVHGTVAILTLGSSGPYAPDYGDTVELSGQLEPVAGSPVHSSKSAQPVAAPAGVFAAMTFPRLVILQRGGNPILAWLFHLRQQLAQAISQSLPEPEASLLIGILLGLKTPVLRAQYPLFQKSGTVHLVVTSGFKVTVLSGLLVAATRRIGGRRWKLALVLAGIGAYTILGGAGPAAIRAGIMGALLAIAPRAGRYYNIYTSLAFAALLMSAWSPYILWDVGFQLSALGTLGIALPSPLLARWLERPLSRVPGGHLGAELLATTVAAQLATLPIQAIDFSQLSLIAPLANLLAVPLLGLLLGTGTLVGSAGLLLPIVGGWVGWACWPLLWLVYQIIAWSAAVPFASLAIGALDLRLVWLYYVGSGLLIAWLLSRPRAARAAVRQKLTREQWRHARQVQARWRVAAALFIVAAACVTTLATLPDHRLHIAWLNVGPQGQAILIQTPAGHTVLIDGGSDAAALEEALGQRLPFWQRTLDLALLTNPKTGHLPGLLDAIAHYHFNQAADAGMLHPTTTYATWHALLEQHNIPYTRIRQGAAIQLEPGTTLQVLAPGPTLAQDTHNEDTNALLLRLVTPGLRVLFLGETDETALNSLAASGVDLRADIVQIALQRNQSPAALPALAALFPAIQPAMIVVTPASATTSKASPPSAAAPETIRTFTIGNTGTLALTEDSGQWWLDR